MDLSPKKVTKFWARVARGAHTECWPWMGHRCASGYGRVTLDYVDYKAHRVAWMLTFERAIPDGLMVMHRCDNRMCVNPSHLALGTAKDNMLDAKLRGRLSSVGAPPGMRHGHAKLTDDDVRRIRTSTLRNTELAKELNVNPATIGKIRRGLRWTHLGM